MPLLLGGQQQQQQFGSMLSMQSSNVLSEQGDKNAVLSFDDGVPVLLQLQLSKKEKMELLHSPPVRTNGQIERHLSLFDLIAVGVGGTLGTGFFLLCSLLTSSYAGPSSTLCWVVSALPALLSGCCFAELSGQIPAAGSTYAYVYASMGELPAVIAAGCLSLEYLVSAAAVARGWGDTMVEWILLALSEASSSSSSGVDNKNNNNVDEDDGWMLRRILRPGWNFNPLAFILSLLVTMVLLRGVKESKTVTNYFTVLKIMGILLMTMTGFSLLEVPNLTPFLPPTLGMHGFFRGSTVSFMGYLGFDEVCCLSAEAMEPQKNMPRAIMCTIAILTVCYMAGTLSLSGMLPYDQIHSVGGFPDAFESRGVEWASTMASLGELIFLPLVVLVALMAQPRLTFALACDGLIPPWFGQLDNTTSGNMWNGTLFAGSLMTIIASFVRLQYLNDFISAGVLVAFSMTNSSLVLLRYESPDSSPGLLETLLFGYNMICFLLSLLLTHTPWCTSSPSPIGMFITGLSCSSALVTCILIQLWCPAASYFGGKSRRATTQHMTVGVVSVKDEYFRTPFVPFLPCLGIAMNWYLIAQLPWNDLAFLAAFLLCAVVFYFSFGYFHSVGNNGGWDAYESCGLSIGMSEVVVVEDSVHGLPIDECGDRNYNTSSNEHGWIFRTK